MTMILQFCIFLHHNSKISQKLTLEMKIAIANEVYISQLIRQNGKTQKLKCQKYQFDETGFMNWTHLSCSNKFSQNNNKKINLSDSLTKYERHAV